MIRSTGILLAGVFAILSGFHFYWAAGGRFGSVVAIPSVGDKPAFSPSPVTTAAVGVALLIAMTVILGQLDVIGSSLPKWIFRWATLGTAALFVLRAVGDFRLVGIFKQVHGTGFAFWDSWLFSPLCLLIAAAALLIVVFEAEI